MCSRYIDGWIDTYGDANRWIDGCVVIDAYVVMLYRRLIDGWIDRWIDRWMDG